MLSFTPLTPDNTDERIEAILSSLPSADEDYVAEIIESLASDDECEYAVSWHSGCLAVRVFDSVYSFIYPIEISEEGDASSLVDKIREYSVKEEIPLIFTDVPSENLGDLLPFFRHANIDAADAEGTYYTVRIISEAAALDELPTIKVDDEIVLDPLTEEDDEAYAALCKDRKTNKFWGFDDLADCDDPSDSYFREVAEGEFARGVAISLAIRYKGSFVGEATLYHFNHLGDCQCAIRVIPAMLRLGIATRTLGALVDYAREIGLTGISSTVMEENIPSRKLCAKHMDEIESPKEGYCTFTRDFTN